MAGEEVKPDSNTAASAAVSQTTFFVFGAVAHYFVLDTSRSM